MLCAGNRVRGELFSALTSRSAAVLPVLHQLVTAYRTMIWAGMLRVLLQNGIPVIEALDLVAQTGVSPGISSQFRKIKECILSGESVAEAFAGAGIIPDMALRLIRGGDRSGTLPEAVGKIERFYGAEYRINSKRVVALAEPAAVLLAGLLVAFVAVGVLLPLADIGSLIE